MTPERRWRTVGSQGGAWACRGGVIPVTATRGTNVYARAPVADARERGIERMRCVAT